MKIGNFVRYYEIKDDEHFGLYVLESEHPDGTPSCREPMVRLKVKSGLVLASHCEEIIGRVTFEDGLIWNCPDSCGGCGCHLIAPCVHCEDHCIGEPS